MNTDNAAPGLGPDLAEAPAASNGRAPAAAEAPAAEARPCADCEDGITLPILGRSSEIALGAVGAFLGALILLMGIDLLTGGRVAAAVGLGGRGGDSADTGS